MQVETVAKGPEQGSLGIGDLARLSGVPVRTIRFYSDEGLLEAHRSSGNHRRFKPLAVDQVILIRRLRALGLSLPAISAVLAGADSLDEAIARERARLDGEISSLFWRHAALEAVADTSPTERGKRLSLISAAADGARAYQTLAAYWLSLISADARPQAVEALLATCVPKPPARPEPAQVIAYAQLLALVSNYNPAAKRQDRQQVAELVRDDGALLMGVRKAYALAQPNGSRGVADLGAALEVFVDAYARSAHRKDTPGYRRELLAHLTPDQEPRLLHYSRLVDEIGTLRDLSANVYCQLINALEHSVISAGIPVHAESDGSDLGSHAAHR